MSERSDAVAPGLSEATPDGEAQRGLRFPGDTPDPAAAPESAPERAGGTAMREELPGRPCSVAATLSLIGEKWSLLAIREISFGNRRFDQIARNTGAPRDRLAARLRALEAGGVIARRQYSEHPARYEYELTAAGEDLRTVLVALRTWGDKWVMDAPPSEFTHSCGHEIDTAIVCRHCDTEVTRQDVRMRVLVPGWDRRGPAAG
jgi:DNA-binding HxlR family transcriptional regulator